MIEAADLRAHLGSDVTDDDEALLVATEARAVELVGAACGEWFGAVAAFVDILDGTGTYEVWLRRTPSTTPTIETRFLGGTWTALDSTLWIISGRRVLRVDGVAFPVGPLSVRASYSAGYASDAPEEVRTAVLDTTRFLFREGRSWTIKDLASPASPSQGGAAGITHIPSVKALIAARWRPMV